MKETVLVIHGTLIGQTPERTAWYIPGSNFCRELDKCLAAKGCAARCWAHLDECGRELSLLRKRDNPWFSWSGANLWIDRLIAAETLRKELLYLESHDWRWYLVAHSHGGNIVLEMLAAGGRRDFQIPGHIILLGTPILTYSTPPLEGGLETTWRFPLPPLSGRALGKTSLGVGLTVSCILIMVIAYILFGLTKTTAFLWPSTTLFQLWPWVIYGFLSVLPIVLFLYIFYFLMLFLNGATRFRHVTYWSTPNEKPPSPVNFVNSEHDEAFGFLSAILNSEDPLQVKGHDLGLKHRMHAAIVAARQMDAVEFPQSDFFSPFVLIGASLLYLSLISGVAYPITMDFNIPLKLFVVGCVFLVLVLLFLTNSTIKIVCLPWRTLRFVYRVVKTLCLALVTGYIRRRAWKTMQAVAFGTLESPHPISQTKVFAIPDPEFAGGDWQYEPLAPEAEAFALNQRRDRLQAEWDETEKMTNAELWSVRRWRDRIGDLATDSHLVHTVYYRHSSAIEQIASILVRYTFHSPMLT